MSSRVPESFPEQRRLPRASKLRLPNWRGDDLRMKDLAGVHFKVMREWTGPGVPSPGCPAAAGFPVFWPKAADAAVANQSADDKPVGEEDGDCDRQRLLGGSGRHARGPRVVELRDCLVRGLVRAFGGGRFTLKRLATHFTTLVNAVEGLTGGTAMSLERFEQQIRDRLPS